MKFSLFSKKEKPTKKTSLVAQNSTLVELLLNTGVSDLSDEDIDLILTDLSVTQCDVSRKAVTEKKEVQILCDREDVAREFKRIFNPDIVSQVLETYLYGINVFEVNWREKDGFLYPRLVQRDFRLFKFDENGELCFTGRGADEPVPPYKAIYALNRANFRKAYGDALLKKLYFPVKMKNAGLKFWFRFLERFGSPWAIAKTDYEPEELAAEVQAMLSGDSAVIDKDEDISLIQPSSSVDFASLPAYFDEQIAKAILGANLAGEVKGGSYAAAQTHNEIRADLAANDGKILEFVMNRAIKFFKEINGANFELEAHIYDEDEPNVERANRDLALSQMGFTPTADYVKRVYNVELDETAPKPEKIANKAGGGGKSLKPIDKISANVAKLDPSGEQIEANLNKLINECDSYEEAFDALYKLYDLPFDELEKYMTKALTNAQMLGAIDE